MSDWQKFPPTKDDKVRLADYRCYHALYRGCPGPARYNGATTLRGKTRKIGIMENFARTISEIWSDLLFGIKPSFSIGEDPSDPANDDPGPEKPESEAQKILNEIVKANQFETILKESAASQSSVGGCVFRVRWGLPPDEKAARVIIEEIPVDNYFVKSSPHNCREILSQTVAWVIMDTNAEGSTGTSGYLYCQEHTAGCYVNSAYRVGSTVAGQRIIGQEVSLQQAYGHEDLPPMQVDHDYPGSLLFYVPNRRDGSTYWGDSDYLGLETVFEAINNRISKIDEYLDKHAEPKFIGLPGMRKPDSTVDMSEMGMIEDDRTELLKFLPRYVTWDGQLNGSMAQLEHLLETLCRIGRMAPAFFGLDKAGSIESGIAMRMRFFSTTSRVNEKKTYYDPVIKRILKAAMTIYGQHNAGADTDQELNVEIFWRHGLPVDDTEKTRLIISRVASQMMSRETGIQHLDGVGRAEALKELAKVTAEMIATAQAQAGINGILNPPQAGQPGQTGAAGGAAGGAQNSKNPAIDPLTAQEQSSSGSLPAKILKGAEISPT